jgi:hypothetical protein
MTLRRARPVGRTTPELGNYPLELLNLLGQCTYSKVQYSPAIRANGRVFVTNSDGRSGRRAVECPQGGHREGGQPLTEGELLFSGVEDDSDPEATAEPVG